jgi:hypothetical protein
MVTAGALDLSAQAAVVKRNVILRQGPAKATANLETLQKNDELTLLDPTETSPVRVRSPALSCEAH